MLKPTKTKINQDKTARTWFVDLFQVQMGATTDNI